EPTMDNCLFNDSVLALNAANTMPPPPPARLLQAERMRAMVVVSGAHVRHGRHSGTTHSQQQQQQ
ncbi:hypothetical protein HDU78_000239, partial [Chytriomyces hyalinus]